MKFKGPANTKFNVHKPKYGEPSAIRFDADGIYETHNRFMAKRLARKFEIVPEDAPIPDIPVETPSGGMNVVKRCRKCDFTCDNQGDLLAHYRKEHPKE